MFVCASPLENKVGVPPVCDRVCVCLCVIVCLGVRYVLGCFDYLFVFVPLFSLEV